MDVFPIFIIMIMIGIALIVIARLVYPNKDTSTQGEKIMHQMLTIWLFFCGLAFLTGGMLTLVSYFILKHV